MAHWQVFEEDEGKYRYIGFNEDKFYKGPNGTLNLPSVSFISDNPKEFNHPIALWCEDASPFYRCLPGGDRMQSYFFEEITRYTFQVDWDDFCDPKSSLWNGRPFGTIPNTRIKFECVNCGKRQSEDRGLHDIYPGITDRLQFCEKCIVRIKRMDWVALTDPDEEEYIEI